MNGAPAILRGRRRIIVVGGGVVGCAIAFELARAGMDVSLVERDAVAAHASGRNAGNLNPLIGSSRELRPIALAAFRQHAVVRAALTELGCGDFGCVPVERMLIGFDEAERAALKTTAALFDSVEGFSARWLDGHEARDLEPRLVREVAFAVATAGSLSLDGGAFTLSLAAASKKLGAKIVRGAATGIESRGNQIVAARIGDARIECDVIVLATGPWTADTQQWLGVEVPVRPVKGEMILLRHPEGPLNRDITWGEFSLYRRGARMWLGVTTSEDGFDDTPTKAARDALLAGASRMVRDIERSTVLDHVAALRPVATPKAPIARRVAGWGNVLLANGVGSKGMLLSVGVAKAIRDLIGDQ